VTASNPDQGSPRVIVSAAVGIVAGLMATVPMTIVMELVRQRLPLRERSSLPPKKVTLSVARQIGVLKRMDEPQRDAATLITHFGFGAAGGAVYAVLVRLIGRSSPVLRGLGFGFAVWLLSYMGWLPAVGLFGPATRDTKARNVLMIAAHLVWGATLGALVDWCSSVGRSAPAKVSD
jgi:uncharacterized membrane protein YagU involved in acid resistance